jgi:hypothetical protein
MNEMILNTIPEHNKTRKKRNRRRKKKRRKKKIWASHPKKR